MNLFARIPSRWLIGTTGLLSLVAISWLRNIFTYLSSQHSAQYVLSAVFTGIIPACIIVFITKYRGAVHQRLRSRQLISLLNASAEKPIKLNNCYGILKSVKSASNANDICILYVPVSQHPPSIVPLSKVITIKRQKSYSSLHEEIKSLLEVNKITILEALNIEYKAVTAVFECHTQISWLSESIHQLKDLEEAMRVSIAKASGNRLLENAISRLLSEKERYTTQLIELDKNYVDVKRMLKELIDYLEMPEASRHILGLDLQLYQSDNARFELVRESFNEVVEMSNTLNALADYTL
jgi:hypothetical protein